MVVNRQSSRRLPIYEGSVLRIQIVDFERLPPGHYQEVPSRKSLVLHAHIRGFAAADRDRLSADVPTLGFEAVLIEQP